MKKIKAWIPNMFTFGNAALGISAIVHTINGNITIGAFLLLIAMVFDFFDGFTARKLNVTSDIGKELDSLADAISFVTAPSLIIYMNYLSPSNWGIIVSALIVIFGIYRLARFNIHGTTKYFVGIPTPLFALVTVILILGNIALSPILASIIFLVLGYLMISKIKIPTFKGGK